MKKKSSKRYPRADYHPAIGRVGESTMLNIIPFRQKIGYCGPASLKMILHYYNVVKEEQELAKMLGRKMMQVIRNRGVSADKLVAVAHKLGFDGFIKDYSTLEDIKHYVVDRKIPIIVDWFMEDEGHYSVVSGMDEENIYLVDPSLGQIRALRIPVFKRVWFDFSESFMRSNNDLILRRMIVISNKRLP